MLQPPIVRTGLLPHATGPSAPRPPSTRDIPPVTLTNIPHIDNSVFKSYLAQAGSLYDAFRRAKEGSDEGRPPLGRSRSNQGVAEPLAHGAQRRTSGGLGLSKLDSVSPVGAPQEQAHLRRRSSGGVSRRAGLAVAPLSTIPNVYFEQDFRLENPRTFDIVSERSEIARPPSGPNGSAVTPGSSGKKALAVNAILQEKLSWYMDTVEIHLISSISTASTSFFAALGSLRELHAEAAQSVEKIKKLRGDLGNLDSGMAVGGMKIVALKRRRDNLHKLGDSVRQLEAIVQAVGSCDERVEKGEVESALKGLADVERLMAGDAGDLPATAQRHGPLDYRGPLIDLRGLKALEGASNDIAFLRKRIGKAYEGKFIDILLGDLRRHIDSVPASSTFQRWEKASSRLRGQHVRTPSEMPTYVQVSGEFRSTLSAQLKGLARSDSIMPAAFTYKDTISREFKNLIRRRLPSSSDDDIESTTSISTQDSRHRSQHEKSSILARNLRSLEAEDAEDMFRKIYSNVGEALRRLGTQVKVLLDITSSLGNPHPSMPLKSPPRSPNMASVDGFLSAEPSPVPAPSLLKQEEIQQALDLSSLLGQAVDVAQLQIIKILKVRSEQTTHLDLPFFLKYFTLNRLFADECEAISGRGGGALKSLVHDHIKAFVNNIAEGEKQRLIQNMDADKWDAKDFTEDDSRRLKLIMGASTNDVPSWCETALLWASEELPGGQSRSKDTVLNGDFAHRDLASVQLNGKEINSVSSKDKVRSATIDEEKYILPNSAMVVLGGIEVYEKLITGIPTMSVDISTLLLDYLKQFNSRSSQLILGAGATRSAGLKNITTRHLALSSQALSFVVAVIPYIREFARRHLPSSNNIMIEFDKVKRLLQEHQSGIHDKFVDIMTGRATSHVNTMKKVDWDAPSGESVNGYMETLVKETATLHKVLARHLPDSAVQLIIVPVMANYKEQWGKAFREAIVKTPEGKGRYVQQSPPKLP